MDRDGFSRLEQRREAKAAPCEDKNEKEREKGPKMVK